jgi:glycosyltransferase involved in cell wall biosynthesis
VIVVDSFSTDRTETIARSAGARFFQHAFSGFGDQRNWALNNAAPRHDWVLVLDADERVTPELAGELALAASLAPAEVAAYRLKRKFYFRRRWLRRAALYPTWLVRFIRKDRVAYVNRGHAESQTIDGLVNPLENDLIDENLKGAPEWHKRQAAYAAKEALYEMGSEKTVGLGSRRGGPMARRDFLKRTLSRVPGRPIFFFLYAYVLRGGFLEGGAALEYCLGKMNYYRLIGKEKKSIGAKEGSRK